jgi:BASS family bile acid:Na+ symporter
MPVLAFGLGKMFFLDEELLAGLIILGCCPGGTASNVMTYLSKGESAFSIGMTAVTNLLSPLITPALTYLFLRKKISVDVKSMILAIVFVVIVPLLLGIIINKVLSRHTENVKYILPSVADIAIFLIVASTVSHNSDRIRATGIKIIIVAVLLNLLGYMFGFIFASAFMMKMKRKKALTLEIGMQNSGMATTLAVTAYPGMAMTAVPAAVFSVWQYVSGAVLAGIFRKISKKSKKSRSKRKD